MEVDGIDEGPESFDPFLMAALLPQNGKFRTEVSEDELMRMIGLTAVRLFRLLQEASPQSPQMPPLIIFSKEKILIPVDRVVEKIAEQHLPSSREEAAAAPVEVILAPVETTAPIVEEPVAEPVKEEVSPRQTREQIQNMIETYRQQMQLLAQSITYERKRIQQQENIDIFNNISRQPYYVGGSKDPEGKIAEYQQAVKELQGKTAQLKQSLQNYR